VEDAFDPERILRLLNARRVAYILIGGLAINLHGYERLTADVDVCYERSRQNVARLVDVLRELHSHPRQWSEGVPFTLDTQTILNGDTFTFSTGAGDLDIIAIPTGSRGYDDLARGAEVHELGDQLPVQVIGLEDLIRLKRATGRPKDAVDVYALEDIRELRAEQSG
jgi:predicted nucleotidyltransferase